MKKKTASDFAWEKYGEKEPYYGVCTEEKFKTSNLNAEGLKLFFESGKKHIDHVLNVFKLLSKDELIALDTVLDFGCGTGRLLVPLSDYVEKVTGIDVSAAMLKEAQKNMKYFGIENVNLIQSNSLDILNSEQFAFVHTFIVLQHIPAEVGYGIIKSLLSLIKPGGLGMIHFTYSNEKSYLKNLKYDLRSKYRLFAQFSNLIKFKHPNKPDMQMNNYNLNRVYRIIEASGINKFYVELTNHGGFRGASFYVIKNKESAVK